MHRKPLDTPCEKENCAIGFKRTSLSLSEVMRPTPTKAETRPSDFVQFSFTYGVSRGFLCICLYSVIPGIFPNEQKKVFLCHLRIKNSS